MINGTVTGDALLQARRLRPHAAPWPSVLLQGQPLELLGSSTTTVTDALALGIITPATSIAGVLILRQAPLGYLVVHGQPSTARMPG